MKARKIVLHCCEWGDRLVDMLWNAAAACLCFILVALAVQIFRRTVLNSPIFGIEEAVTAAVVWFAALGAVVVTKQNGHAQVEFFLRFVPQFLKKPVTALSYTLGLVCSVLMIEGGTRLYAVQSKAVPQGGLPFGRVYYYALPMIVMGEMIALVSATHIIRISLANAKAREGGDII